LLCDKYTTYNELNETDVFLNYLLSTSASRVEDKYPTFLSCLSFTIIQFGFSDITLSINLSIKSSYLNTGNI